MKKLKLILCLFLAGTLCTAAAAAVVKTEQTALSEKLIRLHVIANSDSYVDQRAKLSVRDAVLCCLQEQTWQNREEAAVWLLQNRTLLQQTAETALGKQGVSQTVHVRLTEETYPTRHYDTFSLPAGTYLSLQIVLGEGQGKNWWCVAYPAICMSAAGELSAQAASAGITDSELQLMTEDTPKVRLRFKLLEWLKF